MRVLVTGWASFLHGEATAGDVLSMHRVAAALDAAGIGCDTAWSPVFAPGSFTLDDAEPQRYSHVVFVCGPAHGWQVRRLHERYASCRRVAVGVSVVDPADPAVTGFDEVLARDGGGAAPAKDLACPPRGPAVPVAGVVLAGGQREYGDQRRHDTVHACVGDWLVRLDCAPMVLDTRLQQGQWWQCASPEQCAALFGKADVVVTTRLHGLVLALSQGVPAVAVDPVAGGAKVSAQAARWHWPALVRAEEIETADSRALAVLDGWWRWCLSGEARKMALAIAEQDDRDETLITPLLDVLGARRPVGSASP